MFGASISQVDEVSKHFSIQVVALGSLLIGKGIITQEEYQRALLSATAAVDQHWEERKDEMRRENPGLALFEKLLGGDP